MLPQIIDLGAELGRLKLLRNRTPDMPRAERAGSMGQVAPYRDGAIFTSKFAGEGGWERHPKGDELVHIIDGAATLNLIDEEGPKTITLRAGMIAIVPQGAWHRFDAPEGVTMLTVTPKPTDHPPVHVEDPRTLDATVA